MKIISRIFVLIVLLIGGSVAAYACSCMEQTQRQRFRTADAVFVGEVLELKDLPEAEYEKLREKDVDKRLMVFIHQVTFKVEKQWKGQRQSQITALAEYEIAAMCGMLDLSVGNRILVYAPRDHGQLLIYRTCSPNVPVWRAEKEIKRLNNFFFRAKTFFYPYPKF